MQDDIAAMVAVQIFLVMFIGLLVGVAFFLKWLRDAVYKPIAQGQNKAKQLEADYRWRKVKVGYLLGSAVLLFILLISIIAYTGNEVCSSYFWNGQYRSSCQSLNDTGEAGAVWALFAAVCIVVVVGWLMLPRLYTYLNPSGPTGKE